MALAKSDTTNVHGQLGFFFSLSLSEEGAQPPVPTPHLCGPGPWSRYSGDCTKLDSLSIIIKM